MAVGIFGPLLGLVGLVITVALSYLVIRLAVRDGMLDAQRRGGPPVTGGPAPRP